MLSGQRFHSRVSSALPILTILLSVDNKSSPMLRRLPLIQPTMSHNNTSPQQNICVSITAMYSQLILMSLSFQLWLKVSTLNNKDLSTPAYQCKLISYHLNTAMCFIRLTLLPGQKHIVPSVLLLCHPMNSEWNSFFCPKPIIHHYNASSTNSALIILSHKRPSHLPTVLTSDLSPPHYCHVNKSITLHNNEHCAHSRQTIHILSPSMQKPIRCVLLSCTNIFRVLRYLNHGNDDANEVTAADKFILKSCYLISEEKESLLHAPFYFAMHQCSWQWLNPTNTNRLAG